MKVKICGITNEEDMALAAAAGADYAGILFGLPSPRSVDAATIERLAAAAKVPVALLLFDSDEETATETAALARPAAVQLQGHESPDFVSAFRRRYDGEIWKALHLSADEPAQIDVAAAIASINEYAKAGADGFVLDSVVRAPEGARMGGTGKIHDWNASREIVRAVSKPVFLAGGLRPENVRQAVFAVRPWGVDVSSGVEERVGRKSRAKVESFVRQARMSF